MSKIDGINKAARLEDVIQIKGRPVKRLFEDDIQRWGFIYTDTGERVFSWDIPETDPALIERDKWVASTAGFETSSEGGE